MIGRKLFSRSGADRTTLLVSATGTDDAGALFRLLKPFAEHRVNMTRIESRPSRKRKWDYVFFIDVEGHVSDPPLAKALASLEKHARFSRSSGPTPGRCSDACATRPARCRAAHDSRAACVGRRRLDHGSGRQVDLALRDPVVRAPQNPKTPKPQNPNISYIYMLSIYTIRTLNILCILRILRK